MKQSELQAEHKANERACGRSAAAAALSGVKAAIPGPYSPFLAVGAGVSAGKTWYNGNKAEITEKELNYRNEKDRKKGGFRKLLEKLERGSDDYAADYGRVMAESKAGDTLDKVLQKLKDTYF